MQSSRPSQGRAEGSPVLYESIIPNPKASLLDQIREVMRLKHYSIRTERSYVDWVRRYDLGVLASWREFILPRCSAILENRAT